MKLKHLSFLAARDIGLVNLTPGSNQTFGHKSVEAKHLDQLFSSRILPLPVLPGDDGFDDARNDDDDAEDDEGVEDVLHDVESLHVIPVEEQDNILKHCRRL